MNVLIEGFEVDCVWPAQRVVVEIDGYRYHSSRTAFERDHRRDAILRSRGWLTIRITWRQLESEPYAVIALIAQTLAQPHDGRPTADE
jgi:very-short-patch-repair endonuclease